MDRHKMYIRTRSNKQRESMMNDVEELFNVKPVKEYDANHFYVNVIQEEFDRIFTFLENDERLSGIVY